MTEHMIAVDVPEGKEIASTQNEYDINGHLMATRILFIDKRPEPKFIKVREYIRKHGFGEIMLSLSVVVKGVGESPECIEMGDSFVEWIDKEWRTLYYD